MNRCQMPSNISLYKITFCHLISRRLEFQQVSNHAYKIRDFKIQLMSKVILHMGKNEMEDVTIKCYYNCYNIFWLPPSLGSCTRESWPGHLPGCVLERAQRPRPSASRSGGRSQGPSKKKRSYRHHNI